MRDRCSAYLARLLIIVGVGVAHEQSWSSESCEATPAKTGAALLQRRSSSHFSLANEGGSSASGVESVTSQTHGRRGGLSVSKEVHKQTGAQIVIREDAFVLRRGVGSWMITVKAGCSTALVYGMAKQMPAGTVPQFKGDPDKGGLCIFVMRGTKAQVELELASHEWPSSPLVEADAPCYYDIPKVHSQDLTDRRAALPQTGPLPWGLDRIDSRRAEPDGSYKPEFGLTGKGVHVYVLDTGIRTTHGQFEGRAVPTLETHNSMRTLCQESDTNCAVDGHGFGTHIASTVGGRDFGVAPGVRLHALKVFDDQLGGSTAWILNAVEWVLTDGPRPAVMLMGFARLGHNSDSDHFLSALNTAVEGGVTVVVAAGNFGHRACDFQPAFVPSVITVGATDSNDTRMQVSNAGPCVDIFAPGQGVPLAGFGNNVESLLRGTHLASAYVAGAAALLLQENRWWRPTDVAWVLMHRSTKGSVWDAGRGSPNRLLFVGGYSPPLTLAPTPAPSPAPATMPARNITQGTCTFESWLDSVCANWYNVSDDDADWEVKSGVHDNDNGPVFAAEGKHYLVTSFGYFAWEEKSKAVLKSRPLIVSGRWDLIFSYLLWNSFGNESYWEMGQLAVRLSNTTIWTVHGDQGKKWHKARIRLPSFSAESTIEISIVATTNGDFRQDMAIEALGFERVD